MNALSFGPTDADNIAHVNDVFENYETAISMITTLVDAEHNKKISPVEAKKAFYPIRNIVRGLTTEYNSLHAWAPPDARTYTQSMFESTHEQFLEDVDTAAKIFEEHKFKHGANFSDIVKLPEFKKFKDDLTDLEEAMEKFYTANPLYAEDDYADYVKVPF